MKLSELKIGDTGIIVNIGCEKPLKTRLSHLGLNEGVKIKILRVAPLSDPIEIEVMGFNLAIRRRTAENIEVKGI